MSCDAIYNVKRCGRAAMGEVRCIGLVTCTRTFAAMAKVMAGPHTSCSLPTTPGLSSAMG